MSFEGVFKVVVTTVIGLVVSTFAAFTTDLASIKTKTMLLEKNIDNIHKKVDQIHWYLTKKEK